MGDAVRPTAFTCWMAAQSQEVREGGMALRITAACTCHWGEAAAFKVQLLRGVGFGTMLLHLFKQHTLQQDGHHL